MRRPRALWASLILVGVGAGLVGTGLVCLLRLVQHVAYGYASGSVLDVETFLQGATAASPLRRVCALAACGLVAGAGWWAVHRLGRPLVEVDDAVRADDPRMPVGTTIAHALLQIVTVALGSPLGREAAPREVSATLAAWCTTRLGLEPGERRLLVACAAGAGLAAVYNVPLGGALFTIEVLLDTLRPTAVAAAIVTSSLAALVVRVALDDPRTYELQPFQIHASLVVWSLVAGPLFGAAAAWFARLARSAQERSPRGLGVLAACTAVFLVIGLLAIWFPSILGNGKSAAQVGLAGEVTARVAAVLLVLRFAITVGSLRAGARGGLLTPSVALGALLGVVLGALWSLAWPGTPARAFAFVGATAFLASSRKMPLAAIALMAEFARADSEAVFVAMLAVAGAAWVARAPPRRGALHA